MQKCLAVTSDCSFKENVQSKALERNIIVEYATTIDETVAMIEKNDYLLIAIRADAVDYKYKFSIIRKLTPIPILLFAYTESIDKVKALQMGADAYVVTQNIDYLIESSEALVKFYLRLSGNNPPSSLFISQGNIRINSRTRQVSINEINIKLNRKEYDLLCFFMENPNQVFTYEQIYRHVWGEEYIDNLKYPLRSQVYRLREKLQVDGQKYNYIKTEHSVGYSFEPDC